jgi:hypothetical protein
MGTLSSSELAAISAGIPDLRQVGDKLLVPFSVAPIPDAAVLWLNCRWFSQRGLAIGCDPALRSRVEAWVLEQFAVSTPAARDTSGPDERVAYADRYGDPGGTSPHGGSGRVATIGNFQVKGVGPTPLVGSATWIHSHGHVSLNEAICEAIYGELLDLELPFGAIPVIAIIETGETFRTPQSVGKDIRRALIVRPAILRPAHMLRAPLFVPASNTAPFGPGSDAARTYGVIDYVAGLNESERARLNIPRNIADLFERFAIQAASADVLRLYTGGLFAGNVSMDGAVLDFGVARAMYTWASVRLHAHAQGFGRDLDRLASSARAMQFYATKARCAETQWFAHAVDQAALRRIYANSQLSIFGKLWGDELLDSESRLQIRSAMQRYFEKQQRIQLRERWDGKRPGVDWIHSMLIRDVEASGTKALTPEWELACSIRNLIRNAQGEFRSAADLCWRSASRVLQPRPEVDRQRLESRIKQVLGNAPAGFGARRITALIDKTVGRCRRWWPTCPPGLGVISQRVHHGCSALEVIDGRSGERRWWIEGLMSGDRYLWGRSCLPEADLDRLCPRVRGHNWQCLLEGCALPDTLNGQLSVLPQMKYGSPPAWWS